jgi:DNA-binding MarR family transcriptional regulator
MIKDDIAYIANFLWRESIRNLSLQLTEQEIKLFSSNDYYYLTTIYYMDNPNFSQLAGALKLTKPAISAIIRKLTGMGLIGKVQSAEDKRIFYIHVTEKGKKIIDGDNVSYERIDLLVRELVSSEEKYKIVEELLESIVDRLGMHKSNG